MKVVKFFALVAFSGIVLTSCEQGTKATNDSEVVQEKQEVALLQQATFNVEGMTCAIGCANLIQSKLAGLPGVEQAVVDFDTKTATVIYQEGKQTPEDFTTTVEKIANGIYQVNDMQSQQYSN